MSTAIFEDLFEAEAAFEAEATEPEQVPPVATESLPEVKPLKQGGSSPTAIPFDIETGPIDLASLETLFADEWDETKVKDHGLIGQVFDPATVKVGNLKDQVKIDFKIDEKRKEHEKAVAEATINVAKAREEAWRTFVERAPLSAVTGQVLAIGYGTVVNGDTGTERQVEIECQAPEVPERQLLNNFWQRFLNANSAGVRMIGFNSAGFDLPFLVRRSWLLGVPVPVEALHENRYWNRTFLDLMQVWGCGAYGERIKLDRVAAFFGTSRKSGDGSQFHKLFNGTDADRQAALDYLRQDILVTFEVGRRMGAV